jgi:hypothetical protein
MFAQIGTFRKRMIAPSNPSPLLGKEKLVTYCNGLDHPGGLAFDQPLFNLT